MGERRKFKRFQSSLPAKMEFLHNGSDQILTAELCNISLGGAYIKLDGNTAPGASIDLNILDYENLFGHQLGLHNSQDALNLKICGMIVRTEQLHPDDPRQGVAMVFTSPVRLTPLTKGANT